MLLPHIKLFWKTKRGLSLVSLPHFLHDLLKKNNCLTVWLPLIIGFRNYSQILLVYLTLSPKTPRKRKHFYPTNVDSFKFNNRTSRKRYEICSKLTIKTVELCQWRRSGVFIVHFERLNVSWVVPSFSKPF